MRLFPTVTETIQPYVDFSRIPPDVLNHASLRGTEVHRICLDVYAKGLPVLGIDPECRGYVDSFIRWFDQIVDEVLLTEERLFDEALGYSGQLDLLVRTKQGEVWLTDMKTPLVLSKSWKVQVAAYRNLLITQKGITPDRCGSLRLDPNGKAAKVDWYEGVKAAQDFNIFLSALNCFRYFRS